MSESSKIDIDHLAKLARIELSDQEKSDLNSQVGEILNHFKTLSEVDVSNVEPIAHPFENENAWRADRVVSEWSVEKSLRNAPKTRANQIVVPKVIDDA